MDQPDFAIGSIIVGTARNLDALRDFIDVLDAYLNDKAKDSMKESAPLLAPMLLALHKAGGLARPEDDEEVKNDLDDLALRVPGVDAFEVGDPDEKGVRRVTFNAFPNQDFKSAFEAWGKAQGRTRMLYSSALLNLTSTVELFFSRLLHGYFSMHPEVVCTKEKLFSFEDLEKVESIEDARNHHILSKIEGILRGPLEEWITYLRANLKLSMGYLKDDQPFLDETFQRRNVIVHNGGAANSIYLRKVPEDKRNGINIGTDLTPARSYLNEQIDRFEQACVLIGAEMWKKMESGDEGRAEILNKLAYQHLLAERYTISRSLSLFVVRDKLVSEIHRSIAQLNLWQSEKRLGNWEAIKTEVETADYSAKSLRFQLGRIALLEDFNAFYEMLPRALQAEELTVVEFKSFPIMREVRTDARFAEYEVDTPQHAPRAEVEGISAYGEENAVDVSSA
jgi:hypothetical protein